MTADFTLADLIQELEEHQPKGCKTTDARASGLAAQWVQQPNQRLERDKEFGSEFEEAGAEDRVVYYKGQLKGGAWNTIRDHCIACVFWPVKNWSAVLTMSAH